MIFSALLLLGGCSDHLTGPSGLAQSYFLVAVDGKPLPIALPGTTDGTLLLWRQLNFEIGGRPRRSGTPGRVNYLQSIRTPDQQEHQSTVSLDYSLNGSELNINLCPPGALCLISMELRGTVDPTHDLVLTEYMAGQPGPVYHFAAILPD